MSIFNKKKEYIIVTNRSMVRTVKEFAEKHCAEGCEVDVHVHGCLLEKDNLVTITFESDKAEAIVYSELIDEFWTNYRLAIRRKLIFVFEKEKEEEES